MSETTGSVTETGNPSQTTAGTTTSDAKWYSGVQDAELRGLAELKGWDTADKALTGYRNLEKHMGLPPERLAKIPDKEDAAGWSEFNKRFGWAAPEKAEDYAFKAPDGADGSLLNPMAEKMLKRGVPAEMARGLIEDWYGLQAEYGTVADQQIEAANAREAAELKTEWGANYDGLMQLGARAEKEFGAKAGLNEDQMLLLKDTLGPKAYHKLWAEIGSGLGEAEFVDGKVDQMAMTPDAAKAKLAQLSGDREWFKRYEAGGVKERQEYQALRDIVARAAIR